MYRFQATASASHPLAAVQPAAAPGPADGTTVTDWRFLFAVVRERLRGLARSPPQARNLQQMQAQVLDCVGALDKLNAMPAAEAGRGREPGHEPAQARSDLVQVRDELADSSTGASRGHHLLWHDGLTRLANSGVFRQRLQQSMAASAAAAGEAQLALMVLNVDDFKSINDAHGHSIGDEALRIVAFRLARAVRGADLVGRLGGDEFACLLTHAPGRRQLGLLAAKLGDAVRAPLAIGRLELAISVSIGIAMAPLHGDSADALLTNARLAMQHAKRQHIGHAFAGDATAAVSLAAGS